MEHYDIIIVGAGPAGLNCAYHLAKSGKKVLVLEKNAVVGPKVCAGGLPARDIRYLNPPEKALDKKFKELTVHTPHQTTVVSSNEHFVYTVDRQKLGQWMLKRLRSSDIEVWTKSAVTNISKDSVVVNGSQNIRYKYLVGADGSASFVRRHLGLKTDWLGMTVQYNVPTDDYDKIEIFLDRKLFRLWYAWIFPHKGHVSIGAGANPHALAPKTLNTNFHKWLSKKGIDIGKAKLESFPIACHYKGHRFGNVFLAGDAAGFASGMTGEGIYYALISSEEVARMILDENYKSWPMRNLIKRNFRHAATAGFYDRLGPVTGALHEYFAYYLNTKRGSRKFINRMKGA